MTEAYGRIEWWGGDTKSVGCWRGSCKACWATVGCLLQEQSFSWSSKREPLQDGWQEAKVTKASRRKCWLAAGFCTDVFRGVLILILWLIGVGVLTSVPNGTCSCASNLYSSEGHLVASLVCIWGERDSGLGSLLQWLVCLCTESKAWLRLVSRFVIREVSTGSIPLL